MLVRPIKMARIRGHPFTCITRWIEVNFRSAAATARDGGLKCVYLEDGLFVSEHFGS